MCVDSIFTPLKMNFELAPRTSVLPSEWKKWNIVPIHIKVTSKILQIIAQFLFFWFVIKRLKDLFLAKLTFSSLREETSLEEILFGVSQEYVLGSYCSTFSVWPIFQNEQNWPCKLCRW